MARFADITYVKTRQGWLYFAFVMDIWSRHIAGWSMAQHHGRAGRRGIEIERIDRDDAKTALKNEEIESVFASYQETI